MKKYIIYTFIALFFVALVGCKDYLDINTNPNAPTVTVPDLVLSGAIVESGRIISQDMNNYATYWAGYWAASGTYSQSGDVRRNFRLLNTSFQGVWTNSYLNASDYNFVEKSSSQTPGYDNFVAIAKIMKVYDYHNIIDNYGNLPYTTSLKGFGNLAPVYDVASDVYDSLSLQLDAAVAIIQAAPSSAKPVPKTVDVMFGGDMTKWAQLANTMHLRLLLRQSEVASKASVITTELAKIQANGAGYLTTDALINPGYSKATNLQNPFWESNGLGVGDDVGNRDYNRTSDYSLSFFNAGDPRVDYLFRHPDDLPGSNVGVVAYKGIPFGHIPDAAYTTASTSGFGIGVMPSPAADVIFLSAAQSFFLQAEAAQRGWTAGDPQALFESGVTASFETLFIRGGGKQSDADAAATAYYTSGTQNWDYAASSNKMKAIMIQKWAANCSIDGMEAWCDLRRTGYPDNLPPSLETSKVNPTPPIRLLYPQTEYSNNAAAVNAQGTINQFTSKIFWTP